MFKISLKRNVITQICLNKLGEIISTKVIQASISRFSSLYDTLPIGKIITLKNVRAWVSMDFK